MKKIAVFAVSALLFAACKKEENKTEPTTDKYGSGVLVTNEGIFNSGTGTLSFYDRDSHEITNEIYTAENGVPIGNVLQSGVQFAGNVYLVVNNSQQILVADAGNMKHKATISGFGSPRYMHIINENKAYVTDWGDNTVAVVDLKTNTIVSKINVGTGPENMERVNNLLFVANSGGFAQDSTVTVINTANDEVAATITVGINPQSLQVDANGMLWVLCQGYTDWNDPTNNIAGKLVQIDLSNYSFAKELNFPTTYDHPVKLEMNSAGTVMYYLSSGYEGNVYKMNVSDSQLPTSAYIQGKFYGLGLDYTNNELYTTNALDYNQRGVVYRYNASGVILDSVKAGIIPNNFIFRY